MKKRRCIFASLLVLLGALFLFGCSHSDDDDDGTITITGAAGLAKIGADAAYPLDGKYELTQDITLTNWMPIGAAQTTPFSGTFNGAGHTITLNSFDSAAYTKFEFSDATTAVMLGLFWYIEDGVIENFQLDLNLGSLVSPLDLSGSVDSRMIGGVTGWMGGNTTLKNITASGILAVKMRGGSDSKLQCVGGIAGMINGNSEILDCASDVTVSIDSNSELCIGGIASNINDGGTIARCSAAGTISAVSTNRARAGGILGFNRGGVISQCYATGSVSAESPEDALAGGIAGISTAMIQNEIIEDCYATGTVTATATNSSKRACAGGIAGSHGADPDRGYTGTLTINRCYATGNVISNGGSSNKYSGGIAGTTTYEYDYGTFINACAALSGQLTGSDCGRIAGDLGTGVILTNNIANSGMTGGSFTNNTAIGKDGADVTLPAVQSDFKTTLGWDFTSTWVMSGGYPVLRWQ
jgi:hypothetical protein